MESKDCLLQGELLVHSSLFGFKKQYCKLYNNRIKIGYKVKSRFDLTTACEISENSTRVFCFTIRDHRAEKHLTLAAATYFHKDQWISTLRKVISNLESETSKHRGVAIDESDNGDAGGENAVAPVLYMKVLKTTTKQKQTSVRIPTMMKSMRSRTQFWRKRLTSLMWP